VQSKIAVGISLPKEIVTKIDSERGDVSRSRYLLRIVEKLYRRQTSSFATTKISGGKSLDNGLECQTSSESQFQ
jgi:hypothetical protein